MIDVLGMIKHEKERFQKLKFNRLSNQEKARELEQLRKERIKAEGKAKLEEIRQKEINALNKANASIKPESRFNQVKAKLQEIKKKRESKLKIGVPRSQGVIDKSVFEFGGGNKPYWLK